MLHFTSLAHQVIQTKLEKKNVTHLVEKASGPLERKRSSLHSRARKAISSSPAARQTSISHVDNVNETEYFLLLKNNIFQSVMFLSGFRLIRSSVEGFLFRILKSY